MTADIHVFARGEVLQPSMVDVVISNDEGIDIARIHRDGIVPRLVNFAIFKGNVMSSNKSDASVSSLTVQATDNEVGGIDDF